MVSEKPSVSSAHMGFNKQTNLQGGTPMHDEPVDFELLLMAVERCFACTDTCTEECRFYRSKTFLDNHTAMGIENMEMYVDSFPRGGSNG